MTVKFCGKLGKYWVSVASFNKNGILNFEFPSQNNAKKGKLETKKDTKNEKTFFGLYPGELKPD